MQTTRKFASTSVIDDLKEVCGDRFQLLTPELRSALLVVFSQFQLLKRWKVSGSSHLLMREAIASVPILCWLEQQGLQLEVTRCSVLSDAEVTHIIQLLAENL